MKRLYLLRHAKSSWALPGTRDIHRPLNDRGYAQAQKLNGWFSAEAKKPLVVCCSPALRTRETLEGLRSSLENAEEKICDELYNGSPDTYLQTLWEQDADSVMIIGHNPTCDEISRYLMASSSPGFEKLMAHHFGTAAMAIFDFQGDVWSNIGEASCQLIDFIRPKDL